MTNKIITMAVAFLLVSLPVAHAVIIVPNSVEADSITVNSATVNWETNVLADGKVEYGLNIGQMKIVPQTGGTSIDHSIGFSGLAGGQRYFYRVISEDSLGPTSSDYYDFTTRLIAPTGLAADTTHESILLSWSARSGAIKYKIYKDSSYIGEATSTEYSVAGIQAQTSYTFQVSAIDAYGRESEKSSVLSVTTPARPLNINFVQVTGITDTAATVSWTTDEAIVCHLLYDTDTSLDQSIESGPATQHTIPMSSLNTGTRYYYKINCQGSESSRMNFVTLDVPPTLQISSVQAAVDGNSATITWTTNIESTSTVRYSKDDSFSSSRTTSGRTTDHTVDIENLDAGSTYYYKAQSDSVESAIKNFETGAGSGAGGFLTINPIGDSVKGNTLTLSGVTRSNARVYIFVNNNPVAQIMEQIQGTQFEFEVRLDPGANNGGQGRNKVEVNTWDQNGNKDTAVFYVVADVRAPPLTLSDFPIATKKTSITVNGITEPNSTAEFFVNGKGQGEFAVGPTGEFSKSLRLGADGAYNVSIVAYDAAGNDKTIDKVVRVDRTAPTIEFLPDAGAYKGETHFKLLKIKGKTDPDAIVYATNFGYYTGCKDPQITTKFGGCDEFVRDFEHYDKATWLLDPMSYGIGMRVKTESDSEGFFELTMSLVSRDGNQASENTIIFNVTDAAGNNNDQEHIKIKYLPGCPEWHIGKIESFPTNIYTREMGTSHGLRASVFFPIRYLGIGVPKVTGVHITKDDSNGGLLMKDKNEMQELIEIDNGAKASAYDAETGQLYIYVPVKIKKYTGSNEKLPDKLNAFLDVQLEYSVDGQSASCNVYPVAGFDIQKPYDINSWLTPEQINKTIKKLDRMINSTQEMVDTLEEVALYGLLACGAMVVMDYLKGFAGKGQTKDANGCTSTENGMKNTFWVCDRILCPKAPPNCDDFGPDEGQDYMGPKGKMTQTEYQNQRQINTDLEKRFPDYEKAKDANPGLTRDAYYKQQGADTTYVDGITAPTSYTTQRKTDDGKKEDIFINYYAVENGVIKDPSYSPYETDDGKIVVQIDNYLKKEARSCKDGTLIIISNRIEGGKAGFYSQGTKLPGIVEVRCEKSKTPEQLGTPDANYIQGCYNPECPAFDDTKCFSKDNIAPAGGLWSSFRCACIPGLMEHLKNYLEIMKGAKKCLEQARMGEVRGGFCERLLAQFVCDLLIEALKYILSLAPDDPGPKYSTGDTGVLGKVADYKKNQKQVTNHLSNRYGDIVEGSLGLSTDKLVNQACIVAITGDWSLLEGIFNNFVDKVEVKPVLYVMGESRPYGNDPFTGRMSIGYNIYVGVVPGGETDVRVWLECDPNAYHGDFCGPDAANIPVPGATFHKSKNDPAFNENIAFTDQNSLYWYNKVVMEVRYQLAGKPQIETLTAEIWPKGDLPSSCHFSVMDGISCEILSSVATKGIVELYGPGAGSTLSPKVTRYQDGDQVAAMIKMRNTYQEPFYLIYEIVGTGQKYEYALEPAADSGKYHQQDYYNIWIETASLAGAPGVSGNGPWEIPVNQAFNGEELRISVQNQLLQTIAADIQYTDNSGSTQKFTCNIADRLQTGSPDLKGVYINGVYKDASTFSDTAMKNNYCNTYFSIDSLSSCLARFDGNFFDRAVIISGVETYRCIMSGDVFSGGQKGSDINKIMHITFRNPTFAPTIPETYNIRTIFHGIPLSDKTISKGSSGTSSILKRQVKFNVYEDTNDDKRGDTPIVLAGGGGDQGFTLSYEIGDAISKTAKIDFIEPIGSYFNNDGKEIPIGYNKWNADYVQIEIDGPGVKCKYVPVNTHDSYSVDPNLCGSFSLGRISSGGPPFKELLWTPPSGLARNPTDTYKVKLLAFKNGVSVEAKRNFQFFKEKEPTQEDIMVCLGRGTCAGPYYAPELTTETLGNYNRSSTPVVS